MKHPIFALFLSISVFAFAHQPISSPHVISAKDTRHISASNVPAAVVANFNSMYPTASHVRWSILTGAYADHTQYMAEFRLNGAKRTARYKPDGTYLGGS
jgi:hypothetical protein